MTMFPITSGQLPNSIIASQVVNNIETVQDAMNNVEQEIETGQAFFTPAQNPTGTSQYLQLQDQIASANQYQTNLTTDQSFLQETDSSLQNVTNSLDQANSLLLSGLGATSSASQNQALAAQVQTIIQGLVNTANTTFQGRYIFGGSQSTTAPFTIEGNTVLYNGDGGQINTNVGPSLTTPNNIDGITAFGAISTPVGSDVNPAVTLQTNLSDLNGGRGVHLGSIQVTVNTGLTNITANVDLSHAQTVGDVQQLIENAFPPGLVNVGIVSGVPQDALQITPSSGTVSISDVDGDDTATDLGIASGAAASITGSDLNPNLTLETPLSALNGGAGASTSNGITITDGSLQTTVNISGDVTVQDLLNTLTTADPNLDVGINAAGNGLAISTRLSGANFSIGENGGDDATSLGIRTLTGSTLLSSLNSGQGVPLDTTDASGNPQPADISIQLRSGSTVTVDLSGATTVQDVLNDINAADPGQLVASLNSVGNGISITDNDGVSTGPLTVATNPITTALGIAGTQSSTDPTQPLVGQDVNPIQANGMFNLLEQLQTALSTNNNAALSQLQPLLQQEINRVSGVQADLGSREQMLSQVQNESTTEQTNLQSSMSNVFDVNMTQAITQLTQMQTSMQATLQTAVASMSLSIFSYL